MLLSRYIILSAIFFNCLLETSSGALKERSVTKIEIIIIVQEEFLFLYTSIISLYFKQFN